MFSTPENLIEKFVTLVEDGTTLDSKDIEEKTMDIITMLCSNPNLGITMQKINEKIQSILVKMDNLTLGEKTTQYAHYYVAKELRELKLS